MPLASLSTNQMLPPNLADRLTSFLKWFSASFVQKECSEWVESCRVLLLNMKESPVEMQLSVPQSVSEIALEDASMGSLVKFSSCVH